MKICNNSNKRIRQEKKMEEYFPLICRSYCQKVWIKEILYAMQDKKSVKVVTLIEEHRFFGRLKNYKMHFSREFFECANDIIVNLDKILYVQEDTIVFSEGQMLEGVNREACRTTKMLLAAYKKGLLK